MKPHIHGWAFCKLRATLEVPLSMQTLNDVYYSLARGTRFWLDSRRVPAHALPHYHDGNDSGWDDSTPFDHDRVIESPDSTGGRVRCPDKF